MNFERAYAPAKERRDEPALTELARKLRLAMAAVDCRRALPQKCCCISLDPPPAFGSGRACRAGIGTASGGARRALHCSRPCTI